MKHHGISVPHAPHPILLLALLVALAMTLAGCAAAATPTAAPSPTPTAPPTATPAPTATPTVPSGPTATPDPRPLLSLAAQDSICIGLIAPNAYLLPGLTPDIGDYRLLDGRSLHIEWTTAKAGANGAGATTVHVIRSYRFEGSPEVVAKPDAMEIVDEAFVWNGVTLPLEPASYAQLVATLGAPTRESTDELPGHTERTMEYPGLTIVLDQAEGTADTDHWHGSVTIAQASYATPRGLRLGLTFQEVAALFATGGYAIGRSEWLETGERFTTIENTTNPAWGVGYFEVRFGSNGRVSEIRIGQVW